MNETPSEVSREFRPEHVAGLKLMFVAPVQNQPRHLKRIEEFRRLGVDTIFASFTRDYLKQVSAEEDRIDLGPVSHGKYISRILPMARALRRLLAASRGCTYIYCFGLDCLVLGLLTGLYRGKKVICEVGDIREVMVRTGWSSVCMRFFERKLLRKTSVLVVTSEDFVTHYFRGMQGLANLSYMEIENKVASNARRPGVLKLPCRVRKSKPITIGYFGLLRCRRSLLTLMRLATLAKGRFRVLLFGKLFGLGDMVERISEADFVEYAGEYDSPGDLEKIYSSVDLVWACYPHAEHRGGNWEWAKTNRFYESCFYRRPMICASGTADGRRVKDMCLGCCVDLSSIDATVERLLEVDAEDLVQWADNISRLPSAVFQYGAEHQELLARIGRA